MVGPVNTGSYGGPVEIQYNGVTTENGTFAADETTWGASFVTAMYEFGNNSNLFYSSGIPGIDRIGVLLYGMGDAQVTQTAPGAFNIYNVGCTAAPCDGKIHVDLYLLPNSAGTNFGAPDPAGLTINDRTGFSSFTGITNGSLFMQWEMVAGIQTVDDPGTAFDETTAVLVQHVTSQTLPATGTGDFLANCVGGPGCSLFDTNSQAGGADFFGRFTLSAALTAGQLANGWEGIISDPIETAVPEPGTLGLVGLSVLAAGFLARRREKSRG